MKLDSWSNLKPFTKGRRNSTEYQMLVQDCIEKQLRFGEGTFIEGEAPENWSCLVHPDKIKARVST